MLMWIKIGKQQLMCNDSFAVGSFIKKLKKQKKSFAKIKFN